MTFLCILLLSSAVHSDPPCLSNDPTKPLSQQVAIASRQLDSILAVLGAEQDGDADILPIPKPPRDSGMASGRAMGSPEPR